MGAACKSKEPRDAAPIARTESMVKFDAKMIAALKRFQLTSGDRSKSETVSSFNQVIMRFGKVRTSLDYVRSIFRKFDADGSGAIDHGELQNALKEMGSEVTGEQVKTVFHEADIYENGKLSEKEFFVCLVLGYVLGDVQLSEESIEHGKEIQWAFNNIVSTYLLFDKDASGILSRDEVLQQLSAKSGGSGSVGKGMSSNARWEELDWDNDGTISFREFIWAFESWVSPEEEGTE